MRKVLEVARKRVVLKVMRGKRKKRMRGKLEKTRHLKLVFRLRKKKSDQEQKERLPRAVAVRRWRCLLRKWRVEGGRRRRRRRRGRRWKLRGERESLKRQPLRPRKRGRKLLLISKRRMKSFNL